jgi:cbb3-type cytochrome oxidase subunit 3
MIFILMAIIVLLLCVIVYLNIAFYQQKEIFRMRLQALRKIIVEIDKKQSEQQGQIQLSEELQQTLKESRAILSNDIFDLNYELFDILSKNNLLKK